MNISKNKRVNVRSLMKGQKKVTLLHANKQYLLSITRRGKLILTADEGAANFPLKTSTKGSEPALS